MKSRFKFEKPDEIEGTMTITMSVKDWCELRDQLQTKWPSWELAQQINSLLAQARQILWVEE